MRASRGVARILVAIALASSLLACAYDWEEFAQGGAHGGVPPPTTLPTGDGSVTPIDDAATQRDALATDAFTPSDSGPVDAGTDTTLPCTPSTACLDTAGACGAACGDASAQCIAACSKNSCKNQCRVAERTCRTGCATQCANCTQTAGCPAPAACDAAAGS